MTDKITNDIIKSVKLNKNLDTLSRVVEGWARRNPATVESTVLIPTGYSFWKMRTELGDSNLFFLRRGFLWLNTDSMDKFH